MTTPAAPSPAPLSRSVEDYLKTIYSLSEAAGDAPISTSDIAARLDVAPASVSGMVKRLAESGHLEHELYRGVKLTGEGRRAALAVMRKHRVLETFLITRLGYDWASVHDEAERLEHAASEDLIERMAFALGQPKYDPPGAPIPTADGTIERPGYRALTAVEPGTTVFLREVDDEDPEQLRYLKSLGLVPVVELVVTDRQPYGGPITVKVGGEKGTERVIGPELAAGLRVSDKAE